jgi:uncharacterized glyoxalase superfamily protein PhnB
MTIATKPPPKGWPRMSASVTYREAAKAIDFLCSAFGFEVQLRVDGEAGKIEYSELVIGDGLISASDADRGRPWRKPPKEVDGVNTIQLCFYVDDVDAHCARARAAGAAILSEPKTTDYGDDYWSDRSYEAADPEGHRWYFMQRLRNKGEPGQ